MPLLAMRPVGCCEDILADVWKNCGSVGDCMCERVCDNLSIGALIIYNDWRETPLAADLRDIGKIQWINDPPSGGTLVDTVRPTMLKSSVEGRSCSDGHDASTTR